MLGVAVENVTKSFGAFQALDDVSLNIGLGQVVCFLGPSGCGKTTLLRIIAGLETPSSGRILLNDKDITPLPANQRGFGMVFQSLALFPHLNIEDNIGYSLKLKSRSLPERRARVAELLDMIRLPGIGKRAIGQLSGGQRQRVAIARALAQEPALLLLDEPLSALDAKLREEMQVELKLLQQKLKITTILVTHDQREAMTMGDVIVVMSQGRIQQVGSPIEIYRHPANRFVAGFIGLSNLIDAKIAGDHCVSIAGEIAPTGPHAAGLVRDQDVTLSVRPEDVRLATPCRDGQGLAGQVVFVRDMGSAVEAHVQCAGRQVVSVSTPRDWIGAAPGDAVLVQFTPEACRLLTE